MILDWTKLNLYLKLKLKVIMIVSIIIDNRVAWVAVIRSQPLWSQWVVGSILGSGTSCELSCLLVLSHKGFSPCSPVFLPPQKSTFLNSNSIMGARCQLGRKFCSLPPSHGGEFIKLKLKNNIKNSNNARIFILNGRHFSSSKTYM
jgi:hypothetical protein